MISCTICGKNFREDMDVTIHFLSECSIPKDDNLKLDYWRTIIKLTFDSVIKKIANNTLPTLDKLTIEELRGLLLLYSIGFVDNIPHFNLSKKDTQLLFLKYSPNSVIALMEYGEIIKEDKNGLWSLRGVEK